MDYRTRMNVDVAIKVLPENESTKHIQRTHKAYDQSTGHSVDAYLYKNASGVTFNEQYL